MENVLYAATLTTALVEIIKKSLIPEKMNKIIPLLSLAIGIYIGYFFFKMKDLDILIVGLVASGSYDLAKNTYQSIKK